MNLLVFFYQFMQGGPQYVYLESTVIALSLLPDVLKEENFVSFLQKPIFPTVYSFN